MFTKDQFPTRTEHSLQAPKCSDWIGNRAQRKSNQNGIHTLGLQRDSLFRKANEFNFKINCLHAPGCQLP